MILALIRTNFVTQTGSGGWGGGGEKAECPVRCSQTEAGAPFGAFRWTDPPLVDRRELTCVSISSHRPLLSSRPVETGQDVAAGDAAFRTRSRQADSEPELSPFQADPVSRAIRTGANQNRPLEASWGGPRSFGSAPLLRFRLPTRRSTLASVASPIPPVSRTDQLVPVSARSRKDRTTRLDPTPRPVARAWRRLSVVRVSPEGAVRTRSEVAVNSVQFRIRCTSWTMRVEPKLLPHRPGWRALSGTVTSKDAGISAVKRFSQRHRVIPEPFSLPPASVRLSPRNPPFMHTVVHILHR